MSGRKSKPQESVWIVHIGFQCLALPDHASAKALILALTKARAVDQDILTGHYYKAQPWMEKMSFGTIEADRLHLDREKTEEPNEPAGPTRGCPRLNGEQLLLEGQL